MDEFLTQILVAEAKKAELLHTKKQQLTKYQILALMQDAGFDIGYTTVCRKINEKRAVKRKRLLRKIIAMASALNLILVRHISTLQVNLQRHSLP